ncbi:MAG: efflux RND transporter periplasmic adaptor subunit [Gammaproteobacteria bacterium]|nr:efflux RND transporter periplasmic adaptor subunit [Gammaproteobacteria bacterium]
MKIIPSFQSIVPAVNAGRTGRVLQGCVFVLTLLLATACGQTDGGAERQGAPKVVEIIPYTVNLRPETLEVQAVGTARAEKTATIKADDGGEVTKVYFQAGDHVNKGDILLTLELEEERLAVNRARVAVKDAEQLIARYQGIKLPGAISDSRIDEAKIAAEGARIELELAEIALAKRQVRAPFSGIVGLTNIDAGERITSDTEIARLDDRSILFVDFQAPEEIYGRISSGDTINVEPFSNTGTQYQARVHKIDSRIDQATRSFTVRAAIDNTDDNLRPGMSFKIEFQLPGQSYPVVPEAAIIWGGDGAYVWVVDNGKARRQSVTIVSRQEGQVLVRASIPEGGVVIAEGVQKVREGTAVEFSRLYSRPEQPSSPATIPSMVKPATIPETKSSSGGA